MTVLHRTQPLLRNIRITARVPAFVTDYCDCPVSPRIVPAAMRSDIGIICMSHQERARIIREIMPPPLPSGDRGSTVVKVLCYKSKGRWFDPSWCQWIFH